MKFSYFSMHNFFFILKPFRELKKKSKIFLNIFFHNNPNNNYHNSTFYINLLH